MPASDPVCRQSQSTRVTESRLLASSREPRRLSMRFASRVVGDLRYFWQHELIDAIKKLRLVRKTRFVFRKFSCGEACMLLQGDGFPAHTLYSIYDFCLLSAASGGGAKSCKTKPFLGSPWQQVATKKPINCPSIPIERGAVYRAFGSSRQRSLLCAREQGEFRQPRETAERLRG